MNEKRATDDELAQEALQWDRGALSPAGWEEAPDAVPRANESCALRVQLPVQLVRLVKEFASRAGIGYQVLIKRWLDDRVREEHKQLKEDMANRVLTIKLYSPAFVSHAVSFDATGELGRQISFTSGETGIKATPLVSQG